MFGSVGLAVGRIRIGLLWTDFCRIKLLLLEQNNKNMSTQLANKLGLVIEGGGVRGIYAAGVLDVLHDLRLPFDGVIGVSAGAIHGVSFVSGQKERSYRIYTRFCKDPRFFSLRTWFRTGNIVDNDFCYREIPSVYEPFDEEAFMASRMAFWAVSTNLETGKAEYIRMHRCASDIAPLIASASLPYVSRPVEYHGKLLLDGGCSDRVPLKAFQAMGFTRNVVVLTHPENHRVKDRDAALVRLFYRKYPAFCSTFENSPRVYEETQAYLQDQLSAGTVFVIRPKSPIPLGRLSHDPEAIKRAYNMGCLDALDAAEKLQKWIIENGLH